jgi:hypothetical protein
MLRSSRRVAERDRVRFRKRKDMSNSDARKAEIRRRLNRELVAGMKTERALAASDKHDPRYFSQH